MNNPGLGLTFEQPIVDLEAELSQLQDRDDGSSVVKNSIRNLKNRIADTTKEIYENLTAWETVQVARHPKRPHTPDYLSLAFDEFVELHGDRHFGDDRAILTGFAKIGDHKVMVVGHQKGKNLKERTACSFGCAHPEGYRKALSKMKLAAKFGLPVITFIDTPGAYPGIGAEERGQAWAIAENMYAMSQLKTPIICVVIGEGGSGGALGIGVGDRIAMFEHSYYSVISPEGCAGILWKSHAHAEEAANALRFTSKDLSRLKIVDNIIAEPLGGAHRDHHRTAAQLKLFLVKTLRELCQVPTDELVRQRYQKFRHMGVFFEGSSLTTPDSFNVAGQVSTDE
ncbi:MAG: acetyl-CoA carboxylase carboxyltransferase subunit alpha [Pirellulaceae bacterium]